MRRTSVLLLAALLVLSGCGGGDEDEPKKSPTSDKTPEGGSAQCNELLPHSAVEKLGNGTFLAGKETEVATMDACQWNGSSDPGAVVTVVRSQASVWGERLPLLLDQFQQSGAIDDVDKAKVDRLRSMISSETGLTDEQACEMFTRVQVELQDAKAGTTRVVNFLPEDKPEAVNMQVCEDGRYTSVLLVARGLKGSQTERQRIETAYSRLPE